MAFFLLGESVSIALYLVPCSPYEVGHFYGNRTILDGEFGQRDE